jgi:hypothetical protein
MFVVVVVILVAALCGLMASTVKWGARGAVGGYLSGLIVAALIWPGLLAYAALRFGPSSEAYLYAQHRGWAASLSVGGSWAVLGLVAIFVAAMAGLVMRVLRPRAV